MTIAQPHIEEIAGRVWTFAAEDDGEWLLDSDDCDEEYDGEGGDTK